MTQDYKYTQQEWDKMVGWGLIPENRKIEKEQECLKTQDIQSPSKTS